MNSLTPDEILALRQRMAATQEQMADLTGVTVRTWQRWESGETAMPVATAKLLARMEEE